MNSLVGVIGDLNLENPTHRLTNDALDSLGLSYEWIPTEGLQEQPEASIGRLGGLWIAPGSPYRSMEGALAAIRLARERDIPLVGT